ncbi:MAG: serine hydrolase, partial [Lachnospiraceae bacterium]|nr:serine hydrolase [Lachnospiraceae bacterium]
MDISKFLEIAEPLGVLGVKVTQRGRQAAEWLLEDECRRNVYSAAKSYTSCAVGFAVQEGLVSLGEKLVDAFPGELPDEISGNLAKATVRDLLTMCLGQEQGGLMGAQRPVYEEKNWVK